MSLFDTNANFETIVNPGIWANMEWSQEFWVTLFDKLHYPIMVLDEGGRIFFSNSEATRLLDLDGLVGSKIPSYLDCLFVGDLAPDGVSVNPVSIETRDGSYDFKVEAVPFKDYGTLLVAAGLKVRQSWPNQASSHDGLDQSVAMVGEVSQKVKGPLAGIELYASILDEEITDSGDNSLKSLINEIRDSLREVNEYLTSIESMTRDMKLELETINLIDVIDEALGKMSDIFKAKNVCVWFDQKPIHVLGDRRLLTQLYMNIFLNSVEAMVCGGRLMIRMNQEPDHQTEVVITDTGPGIDYGLTKEIFNPFYSTKGKPLGLGLPVSRRIVEAHDGKIAVGSELTAGARVAVRMPGLPMRAVSEAGKGMAKGHSLN
jgi:nitrogen-specific signal transduction histidine kinase